MATTITLIKNLTQKVEFTTKTELEKFSNQTAYSETISGDVTLPVGWKSSDNIQVIWGDGTKVISRAVGGILEQKGTKATITALIDVSKYTFDINGQLEIGPEGKAITLSVRIGNRPSAQNPKGDLIINFSDTEDGAPGTSIKLNELVTWIQGKSGDNAEVTFPEKEGALPAEQPKNFEIVFKSFYYNITQNTFDFHVESKADNEITFGNFTIKKVGFRITNTPVTFKAEEDDKVKKLPNAVKELAS